MRLLEHFIHDLRSLKAVVQIMTKDTDGEIMLILDPGLIKKLREEPHPSDEWGGVCEVANTVRIVEKVDR